MNFTKNNGFSFKKSLLMRQIKSSICTVTNDSNEMNGSMPLGFSFGGDLRRNKIFLFCGTRKVLHEIYSKIFLVSSGNFGFITSILEKMVVLASHSPRGSIAFKAPRCHATIPCFISTQDTLLFGLCNHSRLTNVLTNVPWNLTISPS